MISAAIDDLNMQDIQSIDKLLANSEKEYNMIIKEKSGIITCPIIEITKLLKEDHCYNLINSSKISIKITRVCSFENSDEED